MSYQEYECPTHGRFTVQQRITDKVPKTRPCAECVKECPWVPSLPAAIIIEGGTT